MAVAAAAAVSLNKKLLNQIGSKINQASYQVKMDRFIFVIVYSTVQYLVANLQSLKCRGLIKYECGVVT